MQVRRTLSVGATPTGLSEGQISVGMADQPPTAWVGVPTSVNPAGVIPITGLVRTVAGAPQPAGSLGQLWWDEDGAQLYAYTGSEWVAAVNLPGGVSVTFPGTPAANQIVTDAVTGAAWRWDAPTQRWMVQATFATPADLSGYLPLTGGTLTGPVDSDSYFNTTSSVGAGFLGVTSSTPGAPSQLRLNAINPSSDPNNNGVISGTRAASIRWQITMPTGEQETGGNAGSDFSISRYDDTGTAIGGVLRLNRQTGQATLNNNVQVSGVMMAGLGIRYGSWAAPVVEILGMIGGTNLTVRLNNTSNYSVPNNYRDGGDTGYVFINNWGIQNALTYAIANTSSGTTGWSCAPSDRRVKDNIKDAADALAAVRRIPVHELDFKPNGGDPEHWSYSFIADEVGKVLPYAVIPALGAQGHSSLHPLHLISTLWRAVQQLSARVEELEAARG